MKTLFISLIFSSACLSAQENGISAFLSEAPDEVVINKYIHSVFIENLYDCIYDGIWVGENSAIPNIEGIRKEFIDGCIEAGVSAMRWPGGCFADHYDWKDGIGHERKERMLVPTANGHPPMISGPMNSSNYAG